MLYQKISSGRFWIMPNDFFEKYKLNSRDFMVYCFLVSKKDKKGKSYWSIRKMAEQCNMSYESVRRAIKSLEDQCSIDVEHCSVNGKKNSNIYTVHRLIWFCFLLLHFWCINNIKARNEKSEWKKRWFLMKICGFWIDFEADFKPSILKQDKGVWFSGISMPENAVRQSLSAFRFVILLRMISNSYAVEAVFRRKSRLLRIHLSVAVWWLKIKKFLQRCEQKLTGSL